MKLFTKEILKKLPKLYATEDTPEDEKKIPLKLFNPMGKQTWYIVEYDPVDRLAFGYVTGMLEDEFGYVSMDEIESITLPLGMKIERDLHWNMNNTIGEVKNKKVS